VSNSTTSCNKCRTPCGSRNTARFRHAEPPRSFSFAAISFLSPLVLLAPVGQAAAQSDSAAADAPTIAVDVDLVVLPATVRDHAVRLFARSSNPEDQFFVVNFNEHVTLGLPRAVGFTSHPEELERAIGATPADGQTALYDAVLEGLERSRAGVPDRKVLIVFSDGGDNVSARALAEVLKKVSESSVVIYTPGIFEPEDPDQNPDVLRRLARATGGDAFFPAQFNEVEAICGRIAHDIRNQYTLGYSSTGSVAPGTLRAVRVEAHAA
jgi:VWFA-related protein